MKRWLAFFLAMMMIVALATISLAEDKPVYLALGDSLTTGYGLSGNAQGFATLVARQQGYALINRAVNGHTAPGLLRQLGNKALLADIARAEVITITCGGNDLMAVLRGEIAACYNAGVPADRPGLQLQPEHVMTVLASPKDARHQGVMLAAVTVLAGNEALGVPPFAGSEAVAEAIAAYVQTMGEALAIIHGANPEVTVVLTTQYNPYGHFMGDYAVLNAGADAGLQVLNRAIMASAETLGYHVADAYTAIAAAEGNLMNASVSPLNLDVHPNAAGHGVIADCVNAVLDAVR